MACIPPNPRKMGYIVPIYGPLDGPLYMGSIYTNTDNLRRGRGRPNIIREEGRKERLGGMDSRNQ